MSKTREFLALDGLRGVAALAVMLCHVEQSPIAEVVGAGAVLAVDFFFILSGFVLAHAYEQRLREGMTTREFMLRRYIRLWPLYAVALAIGVGATILAEFSRLSLLASIAFGALLLPVPIERLSTRYTMTFPLVSPAWSLFWELVANLIFAALAPRLSARVLAAVLAVGAALLVGVWLHYGSLDAGPLIRDLPAGFGRVLFAFFAGVATYRVWKRWRPPALPVALFALALAAMLRFPLPLVWVLIGFPALVFLAASAQPRGLTRSVCAQLGLSSYAVYVLHVPILHLATNLGVPPSAHAVWVLILAAIVGLALILDRLVDAPARAWLERRLIPWVRGGHRRATTAPADARASG